MNEVMTIHAETKVPASDIRQIPNEKLEPYILKMLAHEITYQIINNLKVLPIEYKKEIDGGSSYREPGENHKMKINIISDAELKRLREVENRFYAVMHYAPKI